MIKMIQKNLKESKRISEEFASNSDILAVIGHYDDSVAMSALPAYDKAGLTIYSPSVGGSEFTADSKWAFSGTYTINTQMKYLAAYMNLIKQTKNVLVIQGLSSFGKNAVDAFISEAEKSGMSVRLITDFDDKKSEGFSDDFYVKALESNSSGNKDVYYDSIVILSHSQNADKLIKQIRDSGYSGIIFGADRLATGMIEKLRTIAPKNDPSKYTANLLIAFPFLFTFASKTALEFEAEFKNRYGKEPSIWGAFAADGLELIVSGIRNKGADRAGIRDYIESINSSENALSGCCGKVCLDTPGHSVNRQLIISRISSSGSFKPAYQQIKAVKDKYNLRLLKEKISSGEILISNDSPYFSIKTVYVGVDFEKIDNVDIKGQNFTVSMYLWFRWMGDMDIDNIVFKNGTLGGDNVKEPLRSKVIEGDSEAENWSSFLVKQTFTYPYDLHQFPFDIQSLPIIIGHKNKNENKLMLVIDREKLNDVPLKEIYPQEWDYMRRQDLSGTYTINSTFGNPSYKTGEIQADFSMYQINIVLRRIISPYITSFFVPMFLIILIAFLVSLFPLTQIDARLALVMTALLSVIVFQMAMSASLPSVGYSMKTDWYFFISYILLFTLVFKTLIINRIFDEGNGNEKFAKKCEKIFTIAFIPVSIIFYLLIT